MLEPEILALSHYPFCMNGNAAPKEKQLSMKHTDSSLHQSQTCSLIYFFLEAWRNHSFQIFIRQKFQVNENRILRWLVKKFSSASTFGEKRPKLVPLLQLLCEYRVCMHVHTEEKRNTTYKHYIYQSSNVNYLLVLDATCKSYQITKPEMKYFIWCSTNMLQNWIHF